MYVILNLCQAAQNFNIRENNKKKFANFIHCIACPSDIAAIAPSLTSSAMTNPLPHQFLPSGDFEIWMQ